jgi:hypothetical protein
MDTGKRKFKTLRTKGTCGMSALDYIAVEERTPEMISKLSKPAFASSVVCIRRQWYQKTNEGMVMIKSPAHLNSNILK